MNPSGEGEGKKTYLKYISFTFLFANRETGEYPDCPILIT
jgi:hypothetical protein